MLVNSDININFSYDHIPTLEKASFCDKRIKGLMGPFGSGKSSGCLWEIIQRSAEQPPGTGDIRRTRWAIVRNSYPQLRDTTIKTVLDWLPPMVFGNYLKATHDYIVTGFEGMEIELMFRALDKPEHVSNLLSLELTGAWVNEAREVPWPIIEAIDGRIGRFPSTREGGCGWKGIIMDTNPPSDDSEWHKFFEEERIVEPGDEDYICKTCSEAGSCDQVSTKNSAIFKQPSGLSAEAENICAFEKSSEDYPENSRPGLEYDYYSELKKGKTKTYIDVYIHGDYGYLKEGKPVYESCYNDETHTSKVSLEPVKGKEIIIGFDFGLTPSAVFLQPTATGFVNVLDELLSEGIGIKQFMKKTVIPFMSTKYAGFEFIVTGDPAGNERAPTDERTCFDVMRDFEFEPIPASSNNLVARTGAVEELLSTMTSGVPTFRLDPSCKVLRKGFNSEYKFAKIQGTAERYTEKPAKNKWSHPHDALQYACMMVSAQLLKEKRKARKRPPGPKYVPASSGGY